MNHFVNTGNFPSGGGQQNDIFDKVYVPTFYECLGIGVTFVVAVGLWFATGRAMEWWKERQVINMCLKSPIEMNKLIGGKFLGSRHDFAYAVKKEIDFAARWFKEKSREEVEPHVIESETTGKEVRGMRYLLSRTMSEEEFFLEKFTEDEHDKLLRNMERVSRVQRSIQMLSHWCLLKFQDGNKVHEEKLLRLWNNLMPNTKLKDRITDQWIEIGFQGKDPSTDFRGAGILGLEQLLAITDKGTKYHEKSQKHFEVSINKNFWYFYAVCGLNITK